MTTLNKKIKKTLIEKVGITNISVTTKEAKKYDEYPYYTTITLNKNFQLEDSVIEELAEKLNGLFSIIEITYSKVIPTCKFEDFLAKLEMI